MKKRAISTILAGLLLFAMTFALAACGSDDSTQAADAGADKTTVTIAYLPITHALPLFELKDELEAQDSDIQVELVKYSSWTELLDALNTGRVDGASVLVELAIKAKQEGNDLKLAALGHRDGNVIVASDAVQTAADLKGKTVAIPHRWSSHNILVDLALAKAGLTADDVNLVELTPTEMPSALVGGTIDAYCVAEPFGAVGVALGEGVHVLYTSDELWENSLCCGLVFNGAFLSENETAAKEFTEAYLAAGDALETNGNQQAVASAYLGQDDDILKTSLQWISYNDLTVTEDIYNDLTKKMVEFGLTDTTPSYDEFVFQLN